MRRKQAKKPKILDLKIKIALKVQHLPSSNYSRHPRGFYWMGSYLIDGNDYHIYFQRYSRNIARVDYVHIRCRKDWKALTVKEIKKLAKFLNIE